MGRTKLVFCSLLSSTDFKQKFISTRDIVDGTEFPIKRWVEPVTHQATFSSYKNKNTVTVLVGTSLGGLVVYIYIYIYIYFLQHTVHLPVTAKLVRDRCSA